MGCGTTKDLIMVTDHPEYHDGLYCPQCNPYNPQAIAFRRLLELVNAQAEDAGLWFVAETAPEAYLQQELRRLHRLIEELR